MKIEINENGISMRVEKSPQTGTLRLTHLSSKPYDPALIPDSDIFPMVELESGDADQDRLFGALHANSNPGGDQPFPVYEQYRDTRNESGRRLEFTQRAGALLITSVYQFFDVIPVVRSETIVENRGSSDVPLEYVSSFVLAGLGRDSKGDWSHHHRVHLPFNSWTAELQWRNFTLAELGLGKLHSYGRGTRRVSQSNTGSFCAKELLPMGCLENCIDNSCVAWQLETHTSWHWELAELSNMLYLHLSGPTGAENNWRKILRPGECFRSIPAAVAMTLTLEQAFQALNSYRRRIRRPNPDNQELPVIFNDYMNCLNADPTTEKLLPLIDLAASLGAEYYVIDAGWYADGPWWDSVGEWRESRQRFPNGLREVIDHIRHRGMKPGLWLEIERMGKNCPLAGQWPDECFFCLNGQRVIRRQSLQLDFRHPIVRAHADQVIDRLAGEMGIRFFKMDYNFEIGPGTETDADSFGDGLLQHQRAYLEWLDAVLTRHPGLVIENCASGGMRNTYSLLSRLSICSTTDNTDYLTNARISINCATAYTMEQAGVWSYPLASASNAEVVMNMVSCLSWRPYLSGQVWALNAEQLGLMREGVEVYKHQLRKLIPEASPFWPLGLVTADAPWGVFGLQAENRMIISVWHFDGGSDTLDIPLKQKSISGVRLVYPLSSPCRAEINQGCLRVTCPPKNAAIFELTLRD